MEDKILIILSGLPGSGKSTLAKKLNDTLESVIVSPDSIRSMITGERYDIYWKRLFPSAEKLVKSLTIEVCEELFKKNINVIYDETNTTKADRVAFLKLAKVYGYKVYGYEVNTPAKECKKRRVEDNKGIVTQRWFDVIDEMDSNREPMSVSEGFDRILEEDNGEIEIV